MSSKHFSIHLIRVVLLISILVATLFLRVPTVYAIEWDDENRPAVGEGTIIMMATTMIQAICPVWWWTQQSHSMISLFLIVPIAAILPRGIVSVRRMTTPMRSILRNTLTEV